MPEETETQNTPRDPLFPATHWSALVQACVADTPHAIEGLERMARAYWRPLYVFARQRGAGHEDAADAVQGFFGHLLSGAVLAGVERRETRFRTFLLAVFKNWLTDERARAMAQKRGGGPSARRVRRSGRRWRRALTQRPMRRNKSRTRCGSALRCC